MSNQEDHDLLVRIDERQQAMLEKLNEHVDAHKNFRWMIYGAFITGTVALGFELIK